MNQQGQASSRKGLIEDRTNKQGDESTRKCLIKDRTNQEQESKRTEHINKDRTHQQGPDLSRTGQDLSPEYIYIGQDDLG